MYSKNYVHLPNGHILFEDYIFMDLHIDDSIIPSRNELYLKSKLTLNIKKNSFEKEMYLKINILPFENRLEIVSVDYNLGKSLRFEK